MDVNGLPSCDFKVHRRKDDDCLPIDKFRSGVERILRIIRSQRTTSFTELLNQLQEQVKQQQKKREQRIKKMMMKSNNLTPQQRNEQSILILNQKVDTLTAIITQQQEIIQTMRSEIMDRFNELQGSDKFFLKNIRNPD